MGKTEEFYCNTETDLWKVLDNIVMIWLYVATSVHLGETNQLLAIIHIVTYVPLSMAWLS